MNILPPAKGGIKGSAQQHDVLFLHSLRRKHSSEFSKHTHGLTEDIVLAAVDRRFTHQLLLPDHPPVFDYYSVLRILRSQNYRHRFVAELWLAS